MTKIIDIEALFKMPITDEFTELVFGNEDKKNVEVLLHNNCVQFFAINNLSLLIYDDGSTSISYNRKMKSYVFLNTFQVVRYIDNYLNSLDKKEKLPIDFICEKVKTTNSITFEMGIDKIDGILDFGSILNLRTYQVFNVVGVSRNTKTIMLFFKFTFNNRSNKEVDIKEGDEFHTLKNAK